MAGSEGRGTGTRLASADEIREARISLGSLHEAGLPNKSQTIPINPKQSQ